jgi:hypothetical protein
MPALNAQTTIINEKRTAPADLSFMTPTSFAHITYDIDKTVYGSSIEH